MFIKGGFESGAFIESIVAMMLNNVDSIYLYDVDFDAELYRDA